MSKLGLSQICLPCYISCGAQIRRSQIQGRKSQELLGDALQTLAGTDSGAIPSGGIHIGLTVNGGFVGSCSCCVFHVFQNCCSQWRPWYLVSHMSRLQMFEIWLGMLGVENVEFVFDFAMSIRQAVWLWMGQGPQMFFFLMCQCPFVTGFILYVLINLVTTHMFWSFSNVKGEQQRTWRHFSRHPVILSDDDLGCPITSETNSMLVPLTFSVSVIGWLPSLKLTVHTWN